MYESTPTAREGERIDALVPEIIEATANTAPDEASGTRRTRVGRPADQQTVTTLAALVIVEAFVILALLTGWVIF